MSGIKAWLATGNTITGCTLWTLEPVKNSRSICMQSLVETPAAMAVRTVLLEHDARSGEFEMQSEVLHPPVRRHEVDGQAVYIFGHPIIDGCRDDEVVKRQLAAASGIDAFARELDGCFLIVIHSQKHRSVRVISDRFASYGLYFAQHSGARLAATPSLISLIRRLGGFVANEVAFVEFLHFRRLFGEKTYDSRCTFLASAAILEHNSEGCMVRKYWQPAYQGERLTERSGRDAIVDSLRATMRSHMEGVDGGRRYALFLSGGLDSRALLAAAQQTPACVTTCAVFNNEAEVARDIARTAHASFRFIERPSKAYDGHMSEAISCGNGEHIFTEAHFIGYGALLRGYADCFFLGLGLDVFLGGLYLPKTPVQWFGRNALHYKLDHLDDDVVTAFTRNVKYRLKATDPWTTLKPDDRLRLQDALHESVGEIVSRGRSLGAIGYDLWEYLHLHNFSRHYSFLMIESVRQWAECRAPALCNNLLNVAIALPAELKANSKAYLDALNRLSPQLMRIRSANTNIAAGKLLRQQSMVRAARIIAKMFGANTRVSPGNSDRSWPAPSDVLHSSAELTGLARMLARSENLAALGIFDLTDIQNKIDDHFSGRSDESILLFMLITIDGFLRQVH
jgi:hypothetical protein